MVTLLMARNQKEIKDGLSPLSPFFFLFHLESGMGPPTFEVGLLSSVKPLKTPSQTCPEVCFHGDSECSHIDDGY